MDVSRTISEPACERLQASYRPTVASLHAAPPHALIPVHPDEISNGRDSHQRYLGPEEAALEGGQAAAGRLLLTLILPLPPFDKLLQHQVFNSNFNQAHTVARQA